MTMGEYQDDPPVPVLFVSAYAISTSILSLDKVKLHLKSSGGRL